MGGGGGGGVEDSGGGGGGGGGDVEDLGGGGGGDSEDLGGGGGMLEWWDTVVAVLGVATPELDETPVLLGGGGAEVAGVEDRDE